MVGENRRWFNSKITFTGRRGYYIIRKNGRKNLSQTNVKYEISSENPLFSKWHQVKNLSGMSGVTFSGLNGLAATLQVDEDMIRSRYGELMVNIYVSENLRATRFTRFTGFCSVSKHSQLPAPDIQADY
ncbi:hypothetical protein [Sphingomonas sp. DBB INV C78]|uniref:hypothetical protein n=1 Tax=Sphingomonas sp. DBB INV C78 TaxID=3349434 RepID=UPI0036D274C5